jgi:hypothetical protein
LDTDLVEFKAPPSLKMDFGAQASASDISYIAGIFASLELLVALFRHIINKSSKRVILQLVLSSIALDICTKFEVINLILT